ncbi:MAG: hypothetical protein AAF615_07250 [Pseudomonadota bacterium]
MSEQEFECSANASVERDTAGSDRCVSRRGGALRIVAVMGVAAFVAFAPLITPQSHHAVAATGEPAKAVTARTVDETADAAKQDVAFLERLRGRRNQASEACLPLESVRDRDVRRNADAIRSAGLCVAQFGFAEGGLDWRFTAVSNPAGPRGPVWYLPHDNESAAFDAAVYAVARYGGRLVAVDGGEGRNFRGVDPNRRFARTISDAGPCAMRGPAPIYTDFVMDLFAGKRHVLSMHNNTRGGGLTADIRTQKSIGYRTNGRFSDRDHMVFIAGKAPVDRDRNARRWRDRLLGAGFNVVHETVTAQNNDCSFSNFVALNDGRPYFNIEAVHGSRIQKDMVDALMPLLGYRPI